MLRHAIALSTLLFTATATAQVSGSVTLVSDYRFRGVSLSDERPAAQVAWAYDGGGGWYTGALVSSVRPAGNLRAQLVTYAGIVRPLRRGLDWEAGMDYSTFGGSFHYAYAEAYLGLSSEHTSGRLYYTRHESDRYPPSLYVTLERTWRLTDHLHALAHLGVMRRDGDAEDAAVRYRADARTGLGMTLRNYHLQLFWTVVRGSDAAYAFGYPPYRTTSRQAWGISLSRSW